MTNTRRFEFGTPASKFWQVGVEGNKTLISYGAIGAVPRHSNVDHKDASTANKFAEKKIREKTNKGYQPVEKRAVDDGVCQPPAKRQKKEQVVTENDKVREDKNAGVDTEGDPTDPDSSLQRFEFGNPPTKFWEIQIHKGRTQVRYGAVGKAGRDSIADHKDEQAANKFAQSKIREKLQKGYTKVVTDIDSSIVEQTSPKAESSGSIKASTGPLADGENREVQGSGRNPYVVSRRGDTYSCTCPGWRFQKQNIAARTCKHIRQIQGDEAENARLETTTALVATTATSDKSGGLPFSSVMLAQKYEPEKHDVSSGEWWMSEKLDGVRAIWDGSRFLSRTGNVFHAPPEFVADFPKDVVLDGELFGGRGNFEKASGLVRSMGGSYDQWKNNVTYEIFDLPMMKAPFEERLQTIETLVQSIQHGHAVAHEQVESPDHLQEKLSSIEADDGEGLMLRKKASMYEFKRSHCLLKVKSMQDAEAEVVGHDEGKGKNTGRLGALVCRLPSGKEFKVGTGLSDSDQKNPPPIGSTITFGYFEMTKRGVPRFPTFKRVFTGH